MIKYFNFIFVSPQTLFEILAQLDWINHRWNCDFTFILYVCVSKWSYISVSPQRRRRRPSAVQYLQLGPGSGHLLQRVAAQTLHQLTEAIALDLSQTLLLFHLQTVHLLLIAQLLLPSLRQPLELRLLNFTKYLLFECCIVSCNAVCLCRHTFTQVLYLSTDLRYLTWVFPFSATFYFSSTTSQRDSTTFVWQLWSLTSFIMDYILYYYRLKYAAGYTVSSTFTNNIKVMNTLMQQ